MSERLCHTPFCEHLSRSQRQICSQNKDESAQTGGDLADTTPEFAFGDESGDGVVNPSAPGRWAGGSSSGSAAGLAAGFFPAALGSDTGGSIRVPASYCGVSGIKPTFGRVPRDGVLGVSWTLDHVGPMARTVEDLALVLGVIAGRCDADPYSSPRPVPGYEPLAGSVQGVRVGVVAGWMAEGCSPGVNAALSGALSRLEDLCEHPDRPQRQICSQNGERPEPTN